MELSNEYQYIGRSNVVKDQNNKYGYYILLYMKTSGSVTTGKHTVTAKMRLVSEMNTFYGYATSGSLSVAGVSAASWDWQTVPGTAWNTTSITAGGVTYSKWVDLKESSVSIDVGYGVQKDITVTASFTMRDSSQSWLPQAGVSAKISQTVTLPMIAGASAITSAADVVLGKTCSVKWTPLAAGLAYKLQFSLGNWSYTTGAILPAGNTEYTYTGYTIPMTVANQIPNSSTGTMTVKLYTYSDRTCSLQIGSANTQTFTVASTRVT